MRVKQSIEGCVGGWGPNDWTIPLSKRFKWTLALLALGTLDFYIHQQGRMNGFLDKKNGKVSEMNSKSAGFFFGLK